MVPTKSIRWVLLVCALGWWLAPFSASAQTAAQPVIIHSFNTRAVQGADGLPGLLTAMYFTLHDLTGEVIVNPDIASAQIEVEDGSRYDAQFGDPGIPWQVAMLMDASGSLTSWASYYTYQAVRQGAYNALKQGPQGASYSVVSFAEKPQVLLQSGEAAKAADAIKNMHAASGHACFYDAAFTTLGLLGSASTTRRAMLLFTASIDDCSQHTPQQVIDAANASGTQIFVVGLSGYPLNDKELQSLADGTGGLYQAAVQDQQELAFRKVMATLVAEKLAQATIYPAAGSHKAQLQVTLKSGLVAQSDQVAFKSDKDYQRPPQVKLLGQVQSTHKSIQLNLAVTNPALVSRVEIIVASTATGQAVIDITPPVADTAHTLELSADSLALGEEYNIIIKSTNTANAALPDVTSKFKYEPPAASLTLSLTGLPTISKQHFTFHVEAQNLTDVAVKYKYWLAAQKVDGDIGGTTQVVVPSDTLFVATNNLQAGTYRLFLQALDSQDAMVTQVVFDSLSFAPPTMSDQIVLVLSQLAGNLPMLTLMFVVIVGLLIVVAWLVMPRSTLGRTRRVDLVLQESSRKGRGAAPPSPPPAPAAAAPRYQAPPPAPAAPRPQPPVVAAHPPARPANVEASPTMLVDAAPGAQAAAAAVRRGRLMPQRVPAGVQLPGSVEISKSPFILGRVNADLTVADARVSRRHAVISMEQNMYYIQDAASANGTLVNGVRLQPDRKVPLQPGSVIGLGPEILLRFDIS
jgi:hypothetical protein